MVMVLFCDGLSRPSVMMRCVLSTLTLTAAVMSASTQCFDRKGEPVNDGSNFYPQADPCMMCICDNGRQIMCKAVACLPPQDNSCNRLEKVEDTCCEYKCLDTINNSTVVEDDSITNLGLRLVASTVTSFLVLALLLFVVHRLRQRRLLLAMRRFEIQARRQQLEETESDNHIPDFFGIECPPYEDPPPPYSSPKPSPRILAVEAPPPYEEVDHNQNGNQANTGDRDRLPNRLDNRLHSVGLNHSTAREIDGQQVICTRSVMNEICQLVREHHQTRSARTNGFTEVGSQQELPQRNSSECCTDLTSSRRGTTSLASSQSLNKSSEHESFSQFSGSAETVSNCSCGNEQTLLKKSFSPGSLSNKHDNDCVCKQPGHHSECEEDECACRSPTQAEVQRALQCNSIENRDSYHTPHQFSSLPSRRSVAEQRSDSVSNVGDEKNVINKLPCLPAPLSSDNHCMSQSQGTLMCGQVEMSKSLPLDLPLTSQLNRSPVVEEPDRRDSPGMQKLTDNESYTLRNLRLLNLWNDSVPRYQSPASDSVPRYESLGSPMSTMDKNMVRSHSVNSEISLLSVCSETGEKRASRNAAKVLESDSQYPEIPISAHAMRLTFESFAGDNVQREATPQAHHSLCNNGVCESQSMSNDHQNSVLNPSELNHEHFPPRDEKSMKTRLNAIEENGIEMTSYAKPPAENLLEKQDVTSQQNKQSDPAKHKTRTKKKEKQKPYRHSIGGIPAVKTKRQPSSAGDYDRADKTDTVVEPAIPSDRSTAMREKPAVEPRKKSKTIGCFKQYGFIDDPSHFQSRPTVKDDHEQKIVRQSPRDTRHISVVTKDRGYEDNRHVSVVTKDRGYENQSPLVISKLGSKRQLTSADKSSYSPSPTRHKTSRPRSMIHTTKHASPVPENQHLSENQNIPRRKLQSSRCKKRQSYPVSQTVQSSLDANSSVIMTPTSGVAVERIINNPDTSKSVSNGSVVQTYPKGPEQGSSSNPIGIITVRNGPLSSYV